MRLSQNFFFFFFKCRNNGWKRVKDSLPNRKQEFQLSNLVSRMYSVNNFIPIPVVFLHFRRKSFQLKNTCFRNHIQQNVMWRVSYMQSYQGYFKANNQLMKYVFSFDEKNANLASTAVIFVPPSLFRQEVLNSSHIHIRPLLPNLLYIRNLIKTVKVMFIY